MDKNLAWKCRRGMLELDLVLEKFLKLHYEKLNEGERASFDSLLEEVDPDLFAWLMGFAEAPAQHKVIVDIIRRDVILPQDL